MLSGFNTNVEYRGVLFHVQTEDSGRAHPHLITHLFHGGNILASEKRSYEEHLAEPDLPARVKRLMDEQHGAMVAKLRSGGFDALIRERLGDVLGPASAAPPEPAPAARAVRPAMPPRTGSDAGTGKPLDEVVLDYLVESARRRKRPKQ